MAGQPDDRTNVATADRLIGYLIGWAFSPPLRIPFRHILSRWFKWLLFGIMWLILVIYN